MGVFLSARYPCRVSGYGHRVRASFHARPFAPQSKVIFEDWVNF